MSQWTYVIGAIEIDSLNGMEITVENVNNFLLTAPKITGSERNAEIYVNKQTGWNKAIVISIFGMLRDRTLYKTKKEVKEFISELSKQFDIEYQSIKITS